MTEEERSALFHPRTRGARTQLTPPPFPGFSAQAAPAGGRRLAIITEIQLYIYIYIYITIDK